MTSVETLSNEVDTSDAAKYLQYDEQEDYYGKKNVPGSALWSKIDISNPLAFGMEPDLYSLKFGSGGMEPSAECRVLQPRCTRLVGSRIRFSGKLGKTGRENLGRSCTDGTWKNRLNH